MLTRATDEVASMALATMSSSGSPLAQAAARYLRAGRADVAATMGANCDSPACTAVWESWRRDGQGQREALAQLAQTSDDPQVYAWAYRACQGASSQAPGSCLAVTAARWAQLDPGTPNPGWRSLPRRGLERTPRRSTTPCSMSPARTDTIPGRGAAFGRDHRSRAARRREPARLDGRAGPGRRRRSPSIAGVEPDVAVLQRTGARRFEPARGL